MNDSFNLQFPKLSNNGNGDILPNENDRYNSISLLLNSIVYLHEHNRNKDAFQSIYGESEDQVQDNNGQNEENLQNQSQNEDSGNAQTLNIIEVSKEDFQTDINIGNSFTFENLGFGNKNDKDKEIFTLGNLDMPNNQSSIEQKSTSITPQTSSQQVNSETNEVKKGESNSENYNNICNKIYADDSESNVEMKEELLKFDSVKDSNSEDNSENLHSEKINGKNREQNKDIIPNKCQIDGNRKDKVEINNDLKNILLHSQKNESLNDKSGNQKTKEKSDKNIESNKKKNMKSYNNELNNKKNKNILFRTEVIESEKSIYGLSNKNNNISSTTEDNKMSNNLLNKKRNDALKKVDESLKLKKKLDKIVVIIDEKYKLDLKMENIILSEEFEILRNSITLGNIIYFKKNEDQEYKISFKKENPNETEKKLDEAINKKRGLVKEKIEKIEKDIKDHRKLYDIERSFYREFKDYLEKYKKKYDLFNDFWNDFFEQKEKDITLSSPIKGIKFNFPSFNHNLMKYLFFNERNSDLYEEFLKDKDFHKKYCEKNNIHPKKADNFYRKNFHKIYCDKYKENDLDLIIDKEEDGFDNYS